MLQNPAPPKVNQERSEEQTMSIAIAIDGPSGAGKSTRYKIYKIAIFYSLCQLISICRHSIFQIKYFISIFFNLILRCCCKTY